jgi:DNA/RNA endonuclease G (NUC1)
MPINKLERKIQSLTSIYDDIYVVTGVFYKKDAKMCEWNTNKRIDYIIPAGYYKIILATKNENVYTSTFVFDANDKSDKVCNYASNIKYVSQIANTEFSFEDSKEIKELKCKK